MHILAEAEIGSQSLSRTRKEIRFMLRHRAFAFAAGLLALTGMLSADPRPFTFSNDTYPMGKGEFEFEQHVTWKHHTDEDAGFNTIQFREEFEFGLADNFDLAVYLPTWTYLDTDED